MFAPAVTGNDFKGLTYPFGNRFGVSPILVHFSYSEHFLCERQSSRILDALTLRKGHLDSSIYHDPLCN